MLYLFDNGIKQFNRLTKEIYEYKDPTKLPTYEFWHIKNRVGYVSYDYEPYIDKDNKVRKDEPMCGDFRIWL